MHFRLAATLTMVVTFSAHFVAPAGAQWSGTPISVTAGPSEFNFAKCLSATSTTPASTGTTLNLGVVAWNTCTAEIDGAKIPAKVECEKLTLEQPTKEGVTKGKATIKVVSACTVKLTGASCTINVAPTNNQKLPNITLVKESSNQKDVVEVSTIEATTNGAGCTVAGLKVSYPATPLKIPSLVISNIGLV
jgi:hypothetical protein